MTAPVAVDLLSFFDDLISDAGVSRGEINQARDAVAELLEADREYDEALAASRIGYGSDMEDIAARDRLAEAKQLRAAALSRCGSAQ